MNEDSYQTVAECPALEGRDEWHPFKSPSLDGRGEGRVKRMRPTPTLILPLGGGGDCFRVERKISRALMPGVLLDRLCPVYRGMPWRDLSKCASI
jgi:hypothetical protein